MKEEIEQSVNQGDYIEGWQIVRTFQTCEWVGTKLADANAELERLQKKDTRRYKQYSITPVKIYKSGEAVKKAGYKTR